MLDRGKGQLIFNPRWSSSIIQIAKFFSSAEVIEGIESVGWNHSLLAFVLPDFSIHLGGDVRPTVGAIFPDLPPATKLAEPCVVTPQELQRTAQDSQRGPVFWAVAASVLSNILAPALDREPTGIAVVGTTSVEKLAEALGCQLYRVDGVADVRAAREKEDAHYWPIVYRLGSRLRRSFRRQLLSREPDESWNCLLCTDRLTAQTLHINGGWIVLDASACHRFGSNLLELAGKLVPSYLQHVCQRQLDLDAFDRGLPTCVETVIEDLARFAEDHWGDGASVREARMVLTTDTDCCRVETLAELLGDARRANRLTIVAEAMRPRSQR